MPSRIIVGLSLFTFVGCQASAGAQVEAKSNGSSASSDASLQWSSANTQRSLAQTATNQDGSPITTDANAVSEAPPAMFGARAGLRLAKAASPTCQCLSVAVGNPNDPAFAWEGPAPVTQPSTQVVVALSSEGLPCPVAAKDSLGASYRGYERVGADTVIQVETARLGRPVVAGGIVPKPANGGRILLRSAEPKSPYGKGADGATSNCVLWTSQ